MSYTPNDQQREVIENLSDHILLYASAGTGKTFTVAHRVAKILAEKRATAEQILCLTFTIKAANEMREDVARIVGGDADGVCVQTIHGFCYRLLREEERLRSDRYLQPQVIDEVDEEELLESIYLQNACRWRVENALRRALSKTNTETLETLPLQTLNGRIGWLLKEGFLTREGEWLPATNKETLQPPKGACPTCGRVYTQGEQTCAECGVDLPEILPFPTLEQPRLFVKKKSPLMGIVSWIRHARAELGVYNGDDSVDYLATWLRLKEEYPQRYASMLSYFQPAYGGKGGGAEIDEDVERLLLSHVGALMTGYEQRLLESNQLDFDDLILRTLAYLSDEETCLRYAKRYAYIVVDEMQDTSLTEYTLLKKLFLGNNVMMCGDFFQTIYGWRGSAPELVLEDFRNHFQPKVYAFSENYRATKALAEASFGYLKNTYPALMGKFFPAKMQVNSEQIGEKILCLGFDNYREEAAQIYAYVQKHRPQNPTDLCIMARSNSYVASLTSVFEKCNAAQKNDEDKVRFFTVEKDHGFFKRACVKDVLAVLKLLINPDDRISMERIAGKYIRGVGVRTLARLRECGQTGISVVSFLEESAIRGNDPYGVLLDGAKKGEIVVYDTETTGLDLSKDEAVQISAVRLNEAGEIVDTLDLFIEPTVPIGQGAYETHGFDLAYIRAHGGLTPKEGLERFSAFVKGAVLVGHNSHRFDSRLIRRQLKELGLPPLCVQAEYDTLTIAKQLLPGLPDYKLSTLCAHYGIVNEAAHNALGDITATAAVLWRLLNEGLLPTVAARQELVERYAPKFEKFFAFYRELCDLLAQDKVGEIARRIVERMRLKQYYPAEGDREALLDVVQTLQGAAVYDGEGFLSAYLSDAALSGSQMDVLLKKLQKIPVITVHQAKGCEFSTVILAGVSERLFPSALSKGTPQEEEEKKVFYVAITRAKERLIMTRVAKDYHTGKHIPVSPYFHAIPKEYVWTNRQWEE